ncbi:MAG: hypothetical protein WCH65_04665 [bacterium]
MTAGNCNAVFSILLAKINIRADHPSVKPGTSEKVNVNVPS